MAFLAETSTVKSSLGEEFCKIKLTNAYKPPPPLLSDSQRYEMYCRKVSVRISCAGHRTGFDYGPKVFVSLGKQKIANKNLRWILERQ